MESQETIRVIKTLDNSVELESSDSILKESQSAYKYHKNTRLIKPLKFNDFVKKHHKTIGLVFLVLIFGFPRKNYEILNLKKEIEFLKARNDTNEILHDKKIVNLAEMHRKCKIVYSETTPAFKNIIFDTGKYCNPYSVLSSSANERYAFVGMSGQITFDFGEPRNFKGFTIFHPKTKDLSSAPKKIEIFVDDEKIANLEFDPLEMFGTVKFDTVGTKVRIRICSNNGKSKYTCIYGIYIYGIE